MVMEQRALDGKEDSFIPDGGEEDGTSPGPGSGVLSSPPTLPVLLLLVVTTFPPLNWTRFCAER